MTCHTADEFVVGECWGYERFYRMDRLRSEVMGTLFKCLFSHVLQGFIDDASTLTIAFAVRPASVHVLAAQQARCAIRSHQFHAHSYQLHRVSRGPHGSRICCCYYDKRRRDM